MKITKLLAILTLANVALLAYLLSQVQPIGAQGVAPVVRAQALEIEAKDADAYVRLTTTAGGRQLIRP